MALFNETRRTEIGTKINSLSENIKATKANLVTLNEQIADLRKTVSEETELFTAADLAEVDALIASL